MTNLPPFSYRSTIAWVDDDKLFIKAITRMFSNEYNLQTFDDAHECLHFFENYKPVLASKSFLRGCCELESYDTVEHMPVDLNAEMLTQFRNHPKRFNDISILVIDYNMPNMNGLELCRKLHGLPIKKILLTGEVDHPQAIAAFNEGIIDRFIRKDNPKLIEEMQSHFKFLTSQYFIENTRGLVSHLEADNPLPASDTAFSEFFKNWCITNNIREYYLMDKQGNFLAVDHNDNTFYFIVHTDRTLSSFIELHQDDENVAELIDAVSKRSLIPFFGVGRESWQQQESEWPTCFYPPGIFQGKETYFWTVVKEGV